RVRVSQSTQSARAGPPDCKRELCSLVDIVGKVVRGATRDCLRAAQPGGVGQVERSRRLDHRPGELREIVSVDHDPRLLAEKIVSAADLVGRYDEESVPECFVHHEAPYLPQRGQYEHICIRIKGTELVAL